MQKSHSFDRELTSSGCCDEPQDPKPQQLGELDYPNGFDARHGVKKYPRRVTQSSSD